VTTRGRWRARDMPFVKPASMPAPPTRLVHDPEGLNTAVWPMCPGELVTPVQSFFTRSHAPTPALDPATWRLQVSGLVDRPASFTLAELAERFPRREVTATLMCAGLRRDEFLTIGPLPGELPWGPEPVSTGCWRGFPLAEVLRTVGVGADAKHVEFIGLDSVERLGQRFGFGGSIELDKALGDEVLLATELNDAPLPPDHGFPLRAVVPGWIGARSVKWLGRVNVSAEASQNYFQARAYRMLESTNPREPRDITAGVALTEVPLNAVILEPLAGAIVPAGPVRVRGWAMGPGMREVAAVDVSMTGGRRWIRAEIVARSAGWTWSLWEATLDLPPGHHVLMARATDGDGNTQPPVVGDTWNVKGYNNNAWHRVAVQAG
jgi:sulfite oxidase